MQVLRSTWGCTITQDWSCYDRTPLKTAKPIQFCHHPVWPGHSCSPTSHSCSLALPPQGFLTKQDLSISTHSCSLLSQETQSSRPSISSSNHSCSSGRSHLLPPPPPTCRLTPFSSSNSSCGSSSCSSSCGSSSNSSNGLCQHLLSTAATQLLVNINSQGLNCLLCSNSSKDCMCCKLKGRLLRSKQVDSSSSSSSCRLLVCPKAADQCQLHHSRAFSLSCRPNSSFNSRLRSTNSSKLFLHR